MRPLVALPFFALAALAAPKLALAQAPPFAPPPPPPQAPPPAPYAYGYPPYEAPPAYVPVAPPRAPSAALTPTIGYELGGIASTAVGNFTVGNGPTYGAIADFGIFGGTSIELDYRMHDTSLDATPPGRFTYRLYGLTTHYFEAGAKQDFILSDRVRPFAGISFGGALFAPHASVDNDFRFIGSVFGGVSIFIARGAAVRAQAKLSSIFLTGSSSLFCSSYYGCSYGIGAVGLPQFEFAIGPSFTF